MRSTLVRNILLCVGGHWWFVDTKEYRNIFYIFHDDPDLFASVTCENVRVRVWVWVNKLRHDTAHRAGYGCTLCSKRVMSTRVMKSTARDSAHYAHQHLINRTNTSSTVPRCITRENCSFCNCVPVLSGDDRTPERTGTQFCDLDCEVWMRLMGREVLIMWYVSSCSCSDQRVQSPHCGRLY